MATAAAAAVAIARRRVLGFFFERNAVSPENAVPFVSERSLQQRQFDRFCANGVIKQGGKPGNFYVDVPRWNEWQHGLHNRAKIAILIVLLVMAAVLLFTVGRA
jgi:hypothetical protein